MSRLAFNHLPSVVGIVSSLLAMGCGCNDDVSFPDPVAVQFAETPTNYGAWLDFGAAPDGRRITMTYYDRGAGAIGFATGTPHSDGTIDWNHEQVDGYPGDDGLDRGDRGRYTSHAITDDGTVWASYEDTNNKALLAARRNGPNQWETFSVDSGIAGQGAGTYTSLGILNGQPIIAHHDNVANSLVVSTYDGSSWSSETAASGGVGAYANLLVADGVVYIAFYNRTDGNLELLEGTPGSWSRSTIDDDDDVGAWPNLDLVNGELRIAYHDVGHQDLKLARRNGSWSTEYIDIGDFRGADTALFDQNGLPGIVYFDGDQNDMRLAYQDESGNWVQDRVAGDSSAVGFHNEAIVLGGRVFAGSYDYTNGTLFTTELFSR